MRFDQLPSRGVGEGRLRAFLSREFIRRGVEPHCSQVDPGEETWEYQTIELRRTRYRILVGPGGGFPYQTQHQGQSREPDQLLSVPLCLCGEILWNLWNLKKPVNKSPGLRRWAFAAQATKLPGARPSAEALGNRERGS